jgi:hypothetical protein
MYIFKHPCMKGCLHGEIHLAPDLAVLHANWMVESIAYISVTKAYSHCDASQTYSDCIDTVQTYSLF